MENRDDKSREYGDYGEHCLETVRMMPDQKSRTVQREMAAEWFKLADAMLSGTAGP